VSTRQCTSDSEVFRKHSAFLHRKKFGESWDSFSKTLSLEEREKRKIGYENTPYWKRKERKVRKQQNAQMNSGKGANWEEKPLHQKRRKQQEDSTLPASCGQTSQQPSPD